MKNKWIKKDGDNFVRTAEDPQDDDKKNLNNFLNEPNIEKHDKKLVQKYKTRKHLDIKSIKSS